MTRTPKPVRKKQRPKRPLRAGQPALISKLDAALTARLCAEVRKGLVYETCCRRCKISERAFYEWMAHGQTDAEAGQASAYARFYAAIQEANATAEEVIHTAAVIANPLQILVRRWPAHYPSERLQMELAGKDGGPVAVNAGVHIVIESSVSDGKESAKLSPFMDERPDSPWFGRTGLSTDSTGYIFDGAGRLLGILKDLPAERAPVMSVPVQSGSQTPAAQLDRKVELQERIAELEQDCRSEGGQ
jgi:hypothetical protein